MPTFVLVFTAWLGLTTAITAAAALICRSGHLEDELVGSLASGVLEIPAD